MFCCDHETGNVPEVEPGQGKHHSSTDHKTYYFPEGVVSKSDLLLISSVKVSDSVKKRQKLFLLICNKY